MNKGILFFLTFAMVGCSGSRSPGLGIKDGRLSPCPDSPNCVSSQSQGKSHFVEPISYKGYQKKAKDRLVAVIQGMKRSKIVEQTDDYIHAEYKSAIFRFVDDLEFCFDDAAKSIHIRSASRIGYSDFGVNRKRVEEVRRLFSTAA